MSPSQHSSRLPPELNSGMLKFTNPPKYICFINVSIKLHAARVLPVKLTVTCLVNKFPNIYVTRRSNIAYTTARHWSLPWVTWLCSKSSHLIYLRHIFNNFLTFSPSLASCFFPTDCLTKTLYVPSMSCAQRAPCRLMIRIMFAEKYKFLIMWLFLASHYLLSLSLSLSGLNILLTTLI
jgi:hypothetical protein